MDTLAETAIVDYHFSLADQWKHSSILRSLLQQTNGNCRFPFVPFSVLIFICIHTSTYISIYVYMHIDIYTYIYIYIYVCIYSTVYIYMLKFQTENGSPGDFPESVRPFLIVQTEVCRLSVCWRRNKRKYPFANTCRLKGLNGLNELAHLWSLIVENIPTSHRKIRIIFNKKIKSSALKKKLSSHNFKYRFLQTVLNNVQNENHVTFVTRAVNLSQ